MKPHIPTRQTMAECNFAAICILILAIICTTVSIVHASSPELTDRGTHLTFAPETPEVEIVIQPLSYKQLRSREICDMSTEYGLHDFCPLLIAHLTTECGSMDEYCGWTPGSYRSDAGLAIGIAQFHLCYRYTDWMKENHFGCPHGNPKKAGPIRDKFFQDFPEMKDWRGQARKYLGEIQAKAGSNPTEWSVRRAIDTWNAAPDYMARIDANLHKAATLLY